VMGEVVRLDHRQIGRQCNVDLSAQRVPDPVDLPALTVCLVELRRERRAANPHACGNSATSPRPWSGLAVAC
jgi:hypothetical protein